jgi:RimJ/RimL family protein N-acetyltransferase
MPVPTSAPTLTDGVVTLRAHRVDDVPRIVEQCHDPQSQQWTQVPVPYGVADAEGFVGELVAAGWAAATEWAFAVEVDGAFGGTVSLRNEGAGRLEVAFGAHPGIRGTGAMERALRLLLDWGFAETGATTLVWRAFVGNWASRRLAWRLGFSMEGTLRCFLPQRGELRDAWVATLLREDPREPRTTWLDVPRLAADGLVLRRITSADAPRIQEACSEERTQRWLGQLPTPYTLQDALTYVEGRRELEATGTAVTWALADPDDDRILGTICWFHWTPGAEVEIGFWTHPDARGRGLMTRAARLVTGHVFATLGVLRVTAFAAVDNAASRHVIESAGFRQYGVERYGALVRDGRADMALYDVTASEWSELSSVESERSRAKATTSTTNPASDSATPTISGDR